MSIRGALCGTLAHTGAPLHLFDEFLRFFEPNAGCLPVKFYRLIVSIGTQRLHDVVGHVSKGVEFDIGLLEQERARASKKVSEKKRRQERKCSRRWRLENGRMAPPGAEQKNATKQEDKMPSDQIP